MIDDDVTDLSFIAHVRKRDREIQTVEDHLFEVAEFAKRFASKISLPLSGELLGIAHDLGKYSAEFQRYIRGAAGLSGEEEQQRSDELKGKIDHATAGAQKIWDALHSKVPLHVAQILATCVAWHHGGLPNFIGRDSESPFLKRLQKSREDTFADEILKKGDPQVIAKLEEILNLEQLLEELSTLLKQIYQRENNNCLRHFHYGLLVRFLYSCLIDADRLSAANFDSPKAASFRSDYTQPDWEKHLAALESHLANLASRNHVDDVRNSVSQICFESAMRPKGVFTLRVPTGGGKTLASLRFAFHHAKYHSTDDSNSGFDRIIYVLPYTSIIEQNAETVRNIIGDDNVIEHHSNLIPENDTWRNRVLSENWDGPVVFTTSVQFLNTLYAASTNDVRRMHQLANALIIFDEIQALPIKTVHLFNNAINFLAESCHSSVILCTATQPLLHTVDSNRGALRLNNDSNIISEELPLFEQLRRTNILDQCKIGGWNFQEIADFASKQATDYGSVLIIVNTKASALAIYNSLSAASNAVVYHLSTNMCPAHRKDTLAAIRSVLASPGSAPVICVSTQLIEAGVDLDFGVVIRSLAGLDSIAQAAGRCNRNGKQATAAPVFIINLEEENITRLPDIQKGQEVTRRILDEFRADPASMDNDLLSAKAMDRFYHYYFHQRRDEMNYPILAKNHPDIGCDTNLLDLFSENSTFIESYKRTKKIYPHIPLRQAFSMAGKAFRVIDAPTIGIIVPYGDGGRQVINDLAAMVLDGPIEKQRAILRRAQQYSVNVFPYLLDRLHESGAIFEAQKDTGIYYLDEQFYSDKSGISLEEAMSMTFLNV